VEFPKIQQAPPLGRLIRTAIIAQLLMLVSAFAGLDLIKNAYKIAVDMRYRFFSFGDAMLIL